MLTPDEISLLFKKSWSQLKTQPIKNSKQLEKLADKVSTGRTTHGARLFNKVFQTARLPQQTFHSTPWRDKQINEKHLEIFNRVIKALNKRKVPLYKIWLCSGSGSQEKFWEVIFTEKGVPLALTAVIMMKPLYKKPSENKKINGLYLAVPEISQILHDQKEPLILFNIATSGLATVFVGGSDYPGEVYKPICKAHNGWVYDLDGFEIHGAGYTANYINPRGQAKQTLVVISGLSLHGKTALSSLDGTQPAFLAGESTLKEVQFLGIHDDYLAFLPLDIQRKSWEVFTYAPQGLFPAIYGEKEDASLVADPRTILFSVWTDKKGKADFTKKMNDTVNQRSASPIDTLEVFKRGKRVVRNFEKIVIVILTRNNFCPAAIIFKNPIDFAYSYAGVVVQKTDAIAGDFPDIYYNFACTDFDVVKRHQYLYRLVETFNNFGPPLVLAMMNTGAPKLEESMRIRDAIASGYAKTKFDQNLGVEIVNQVPGFEKPYLPWQQGDFSYKETVNQWKKQQKERRKFMKTKGRCDPKKLLDLIGKPKALV